VFLFHVLKTALRIASRPNKVQVIWAETVVKEKTFAAADV
jgi:hypothetical protein